MLWRYWALRIQVWDLLVKPVSHSELSQRIGSLIEVTRQRILAHRATSGFRRKSTRQPRS